jgi:tetratricopeptide (TPR) repeat protein
MPDSVAPPPTSGANHQEFSIVESIQASPIRAGRYEVHGVMGEGGMATVRRARDLTSDASIALKCLHAPDADKPDRALRARVLFEREYHVLSQLAHPRVVRVHDYHVDEQGPFYTMELLDGGDLHTLAPVDWRRACALIRDVCSVVALLHSRRLIHRDLSPRNVRCTADGRAKLIDLGAVIPMGPVKQVVGTASICAPEVLGLEALDARSDLYSLGATLYYALTGRHAYPARDFNHVRKLWGEPIAPPSAIAHDVPAELDALVMSLLSLDLDARPAHAAEVLERLSGIAGLPNDEQLHVSHAYLISPTLVGREASLGRVRKKLGRALERRGSSTLVLGEQGVGRSRFAAASVLEGKLLGFVALRADSIDGQRGDYGGVRALAAQLLDNLPEASLEAARPLAAVLAHAVPELLKRMPEIVLETFADPQLKRPRIQQALREWLIAVSRHKPLLIAIDDVDRVDEPTSALAALLAREIGKHRVTLLATARSTGAQPMFGAMKMLHDTSTKLALEPLEAGDVADLVRSLFGQTQHLEPLAQRMFEVAGGNPCDVMALAQQLLDRNVVRYEAGSWLIPARLGEQELPRTLSLAQRARVEALGTLALQLTRTLAYAPELKIGFDEGQLLLGGIDPSGMIRALDELLVSGILLASAGRFELAQKSYVELLKQGVSSEAERAIRRALATLFEARGDQFRLAQELMRSGDEQRGVDVLLDHARASQVVTDGDSDAYQRLLRELPADWFATYARAIELCRASGRPRVDVHTLFGRMASFSPGGNGDCIAGRSLLAQLKHDAGIDIYLSLEPAMDPLERLKKSFELAAQRHLAMPEIERVLEPAAALRPLAQACILICGWVATRLDVDLWSELPPLQQLEPLSPALGVVHLLNEGVGKRITARYEQARALYGAVLARLDQPDRAGLDETYRLYAKRGVTVGLGMIEAPMGLPSALERVRALKGSALHEINAAQIEMLYRLWQGDARGAEEAKQRADVLRLQNSGRSLFEGGHLMAEITAYAASDDLLRVKQTLDGIALMASNLPAWVPILRYARGEYQRIRGNHGEALAELTGALELTAPGRHQMWCDIAGAQVRVLEALGRSDEACELGARLARDAEAAGLHFAQNPLKLALACALASADDHIGGATLASEVVDDLRALGTTGLHLGLAYEARARVALRAGDREAYVAAASRCGEIFRSVGNRALVAKHERLLQEGRSESAAALTAGSAALLSSLATATHMTTALSSCPGPRERARLGLDLLIVRSGAVGGFLFAIEPSGPVLVAQAGLEEPPLGLTHAVAEHLKLDRESSDSTASDAPTNIEPVTSITSLTAFAPFAAEGRELRPCLVGHLTDNGYEITGLALLVTHASRSYVSPVEIASHLSRSWFDAGDVTSIGAWLTAQVG